MAYTPINWQDGDIITAEKMNKIENGIATGGSGDEYDLIVIDHLTSDGESSNGYEVYGKPFNEIWEKLTTYVPIKRFWISSFDGGIISHGLLPYITATPNNLIIVDDQEVVENMIDFTIQITENYIYNGSNYVPYTYDVSTKKYHFDGEYSTEVR